MPRKAHTRMVGTYLEGSMATQKEMTCTGESGGTCLTCAPHQYRSTDDGEWDSSCVTCPDGWTSQAAVAQAAGFVSTNDDFTKCVRCAGEMAGKGGRCNLRCADDTFPSSNRTHCLVIANVRVSRIAVADDDKGADALSDDEKNDRKYRRNDRIKVTWESWFLSGYDAKNDAVKIGTNMGLEEGRFVVRLCKADDEDCKNGKPKEGSDSSPSIFWTSRSVQDLPTRVKGGMHEASFPLRRPSLHCGGEDSVNLIAQVGYDAVGLTNHMADSKVGTRQHPADWKTGIVNLAFRVRANAATEITLLRNSKPTLSPKALSIVPQKIFVTSPAISCFASRLSIQDQDARQGTYHRFAATHAKESFDEISNTLSLKLDNDLDFKSFIFEKGTQNELARTTGGARNTLYLQPDSNDQHDLSSGLSHKIYCRAVPTDSCNAGDASEPSTQVEVSTLELEPKFGPIRGGTDVVVTGRGFLPGGNDEKNYKCTFLNHTWNGTATSSNTITCRTGVYVG